MIRHAILLTILTLASSEDVLQQHPRSFKDLSPTCLNYWNNFEKSKEIACASAMLDILSSCSENNTDRMNGLNGWEISNECRRLYTDYWGGEL
jgi:hypothetical protein